MILRTAIWNGIAVAAWIVLAPLARPRFRPGLGNFVALWIVPALVFQAIVHLADPDQALAFADADGSDRLLEHPRDRHLDGVVGRDGHHPERHHVSDSHS